MTKHVAILMGGWSVEREVSLVSGGAVGDALEARGYRVSRIDVGRDVARVLAETAPDVAFNALHGRFGEDGCVQGLLEMLGIPYTHSGVRASALAMHKPAAIEIFLAAGLPCPEGAVMTRAALGEAPPFEPPFVIKPLNEGSGVGVRIIHAGDNLAMLTDDEWSFGEDVLVERYIPGREIQVAVMGDSVLGAIEIRPRNEFYDYEAKYTDGKAEHLMPAPIPESAYRQALDYALRAHRSLGCRGVTRADLRYDDTERSPGEFYLLEINTQPGMTPLSLVPEIAAHAGIGFGELVSWMVEDARCDA